jgi:hypothetical protein
MISNGCSLLKDPWEVEEEMCVGIRKQWTVPHIPRYTLEIMHHATDRAEREQLIVLLRYL